MIDYRVQGDGFYCKYCEHYGIKLVTKSDLGFGGKVGIKRRRVGREEEGRRSGGG